MIKKNYILLFFVATLIVSFILKEKQSEVAEFHEGRFTVQTFKTDGGGWGYFISNGKKRIIKQELIPAVPGKIPFQSEEDALKTGRFVIKKLSKNKLPTINRQELDSLRIFLGS